MAKRIYVGGLPYATTNQELQQYFAGFGAVTSAIIITDKATGRSKGFGFVEMENDAEAVDAIEKTNGAEMGGRKLTVSEAYPSDRPQSR